MKGHTAVFVTKLSLDQKVARQQNVSQKPDELDSNSYYLEQRGITYSTAFLAYCLRRFIFNDDRAIHRLQLAQLLLSPVLYCLC